ncbi:MAG: alpha/beta hydrolase [Planctomycetota bacterium]|jgi:fermentation-respiration switch protein FrsA (DUF1100 family)
MQSVFITVFVTLILGYVVFGLLVFLRQDSILYYPERQITYTPQAIGLEFEDVTFKTADGLKLNGWFVPADGAEYTVLFCHGNAGNIMHRLDSVDIFCKLPVNCFIFDYRGYGKSEGKVSEKGMYLDAEAAYKWLIEEKGMSPKEIIFFGRSLGGSVAAYLASKVEAAGLVIESAFTSYVDAGKKFYPYLPVRLFARYSYDTIGYLRKVNCPVMVIHSADDEIIAFEFGQKLYKMANEPKEFVEIAGGHNDGFLVSGEIYTRAWENWLRSLEK